QCNVVPGGFNPCGEVHDRKRSAWVLFLLPAPFSSAPFSAMKQPIISVSGLRGIVGESLSPELAMRYVCAYAALAPAGPIVLARDGRTTGNMLADAIRSALVAVGRNVMWADVASTPTV